jgi:hypothetical protein
MGLAGIIATGLIVGMGGDNYWALGQIGVLGPPHARGRLVMIACGVLVGGLDLTALGFMFAALVTLLLGQKDVA